MAHVRRSLRIVGMPCFGPLPSHKCTFGCLHHIPGPMPKSCWLATTPAQPPPSAHPSAPISPMQSASSMPDRRRVAAVSGTSASSVASSEAAACALRRRACMCA